MKIRNKTIDKKIQDYLDYQFRDVKETQQLFEIKEELFVSLKERISSLIKSGKNENEAYEEALRTMGNLDGLVEDMRQYGEDPVKQNIYTKMQERISVATIMIGALSVLFGVLTSSMLYFMDGQDGNSVLGAGFTFTIIGIPLMLYGYLTRETVKRYAMNKIRAMIYSLSVGMIMFGLFTSGFSYNGSGEMYIAIASTMPFLIIGVGTFLFLSLTGKRQLKKTV